MEGFFLYTYTTLECYYNSDWLMRFITQKTALLLFSIGESGSEMLHFTVKSVDKDTLKLDH